MGLLTLTSSFILVGCLDSPLFNHADASPAALKQPLTEDQSCPLKFEKEGLCASMAWTKLPSDEEKGEFTLRFWQSASGTESGPYVTPSGSVFVKLWMPGMGHGSSPVTVKSAVDAGGLSVPGVFFASDVYFVMPGEWEIWVQLRQDRVVTDQAKVDVKI